jgi:hypothetical protein
MSIASFETHLENEPHEAESSSFALHNPNVVVMKDIKRRVLTLCCLVGAVLAIVTNVVLLIRASVEREVPERLVDPPPPSLLSFFSSHGSGEKSCESNSKARFNRWSFSTETAAICVIVKEEELYIDEWVDYHLALGFDAIYIYDNSDEHEMRQWGEEKGCHVTVKHFPGEAQQMKAYQDCAESYGRNHTWAAFFDADEFLMLKKHEHVVDFLAKYCPKGAIGINWVVFGTSGRLIYAPLPVTKRFVYREGDTVNPHVKSIVRMRDLSSGGPSNPHYVFSKQDKHKTRDTNGRAFRGPFNSDGPSDAAVFHHYHKKSRKEYIRKRTRGNVFRVNDQKQDELIADAKATINGQANGTVFDDSAWKAMKIFVPKYAAFDQTTVPF